VRAAARGAVDLVEAVADARRIAIRAGLRPHRFIPIWAVVVEGRIFVRSWSLRPRSWYRTLLEEARATIRVGQRSVRVRAVHTRSARLKAAVDRAYLAKYGGPTEVRFARDMARAKSRASTTELVRDDLA
jgi:hypothetical protein